MPLNALANNRVTFLDGIRGWAAIIVYLHHIINYFIVKLYTVYAEIVPNVFRYGRYGVYLFFVVSGFALSIKFIRHPGQHSLLQESIARYLRLSIPIFIVTLITCLCLKLGLDYNKIAGQHLRISMLKSHLNVEPEWVTAITYAFYAVFFDFYKGYNSALWTMPIELLGSMIIFTFMILILPKCKKSIALCIAGLTAIGLLFVHPMIACFVWGYLLAELYESQKLRSKTLDILGVAAFAAVLYGVSTHMPLHPRDIAIASVASIICVCYSRYLQRFFTCAVSSFLGRISFAFYLIHTLIICTFSSYLYLYLQYKGYTDANNAHLVFACTTILTLIAAYALSFADKESALWAKKTAGKIAKRVGIKPLTPNP